MANVRVPSGPKGSLILGNASDIVRDPLAFFARCRACGDVVRIRLGPLVAYLLNHPDDIEYVLRTNHRNFIKDRSTRMLSSFLGQGLLTSDGDTWRTERRLAQPAFQTDQLRKYTPLMVAAAQRQLARWRPHQLRDIHRDMMHLTLDVVAEALLGSRLTGVAERIGRALDAGMDYFGNPLVYFTWLNWLPTPGNRRFRRARRDFDELLYGLIRQRREEGGIGDDLLSRLLAARDDDGRAMSDRQLRDQLATLLLAGHETVALALSYTFYLLAQNPKAEAKLHAELDEVLDGRPPTGDDLPRLCYAEWVVKEAMRLYPPAYSIGREAVADCEIGGYRIRKGAQVAMVQWSVHRDPRWYAEPEQFRPERWEPEQARRLPRCAYFPFGDGPRICIGNNFAMMEAVLVLATLARHYRLELEPGPPLQFHLSVTLRPRDGVRMVLRKR
jgi:cytochrome P450